MIEPTEQDLIDARALRNGELGKLITAFIHAGSLQEGNDAIQEIDALVSRVIAKARASGTRRGVMATAGATALLFVCFMFIVRGHP